MKSKLGEQWHEAGADLGFRVTEPFILSTSSGGQLAFDVLIHDFGSSQGMLLMEQWDSVKAKAASESGFGYSCMGGGSYERESIIEVLQDWGWSKSEPAPEWLSGPTSP
jgi:hypothetical protein